MNTDNNDIKAVEDAAIPEPTDKDKIWALEKIIEIEQKRVKELENTLKDILRRNAEEPFDNIIAIIQQALNK
jgi:hypothetical protein